AIATVGPAPARRSSSSHTPLARPERSACLLQEPAGTFSSLYSPFASVTAENWRPVSRSVAVIVTPGRTDFVSSVTVPTTDTFWAYAAAVRLDENAARTSVLRMLRPTCLLGEESIGRRPECYELASILVPVSSSASGLFLPWLAEAEYRTASIFW